MRDALLFNYQCHSSLFSGSGRLYNFVSYFRNMLIMRYDEDAFTQSRSFLFNQLNHRYLKVHIPSALQDVVIVYVHQSHFSSLVAEIFVNMMSCALMA